MQKRHSNQRPSRWLIDLRNQLLRIASSRVDESDVEDVVQEAMRIIVEKGVDRGAEPVDDTAPLAWCFQVLRNVIGNYYQRRRTSQRWIDSSDVDNAPDPAVFEALDSDRTLALIEGALAVMRRSDPDCAGYLSRLADGERAGTIADGHSIDRAAFYRRLYRCREKLRGLLAAKGVVV
jgi:DNA-directed RNA polymerase specialized sigma24 family protein